MNALGDAWIKLGEKYPPNGAYRILFGKKKTMNHKNTCMFILSHIIYDMTTGDNQPINSHLDLIEKREGVAGLADLADHLAGIVADKTTEDDDTSELYDRCKQELDDHLAKMK